MLKFIAAIVIIFVNLSALALDLQEAMTSAYNNNDAFKISRRTFINEIEQFPQALAGFLPDVSASVNSSNNKSKNIGQFATNASERKTLQNNLTVTQSIFSGGSGVAGLKAAQSAFKASRGKYYASEQQTLLDAIQAYLNYVEAQELYKVSESSVNSNKKQLEAVTERLKVGESTETELAGAKAGLAVAETNMLTSYANLQSLKANFIKMFGTEPVNTNMPTIPEGLPSTFDELSKRSLAANPSIDQVRHTINAAKANETVAKSTLLPQVNFQVQTGKTLYDPETPAGLFNSATANSKSVTSSVSVQIPLFTKGGADYSRIRQAKNSTRNTVLQLDDLLKQNNSNCVSSWENFVAAKSKITATTQGVEAAQISYDGTIEEEKVGSKSILDVLNAEDRLNKAKTDKVAAYKQYVLAAYQMKALIGQLTAKSLKLKVTYFEPEQEFKKAKMKIIGF
ncbi:TolC family protein [Candidatus Trichorickettsia mobilis]|uniref:TolC family protein n=1 Tax=Candidatus Trichorickettsia mobilis TaxID=1346319 RepID=A0ABZ0URL2_9RICK|nr:TolC family protein [Candidatus Trichorickettsia mobilis]WPY00283.1 TolC family protein [Candidatus Trichorickettsia mobilis]